MTNYNVVTKEVPTFYFIGVTTGKSSIMKVFPLWMEVLGRPDVVIEGHTDNVGSAAYNQKLSQRRADSVRKYLIDNYNIDPDRIDAMGYGEEKPIASNDTEAGRSQNRRIQAVLSAETEIFQKK